MSRFTFKSALPLPKIKGQCLYLDIFLKRAMPVYRHFFKGHSLGTLDFVPPYNFFFISCNDTSTFGLSSTSEYLEGGRREGG